MDTVSLNTHTWNAGGDRRALLVHGLGSDGRTMWRLAEHLAQKGFAVTAPDLRGSGSSPSAEAYGVQELAGDLRALGTGWDIVVGHSWGGAIAASLLSDPDFARCGLLLDPVIYLSEEAKPAVTAAIQDDVRRLTPEVLRAEAPYWDEEDRIRLAEASAKVAPEVVAAAVADTTPWDFREAARRWTVPVTVLAADPAMGAFVDDEMVTYLRQIPAVTVHVVTGADHSVHRAAPAAVLDALDALLARL